MVRAADEALDAVDAATLRLQRSCEALQVYAIRNPGMVANHPRFESFLKGAFHSKRQEQHQYIADVARNVYERTIRYRAAPPSKIKKKKKIDCSKGKKEDDDDDDFRSGRNSFSSRLSRLEKLIRAPKLDVALAMPLLKSLYKMPVDGAELRRSNAIAIVSALDRHPNAKVCKRASSLAKKFRADVKLEKLRVRPEGETGAEQIARLAKKAKLLDAKHAREKRSKRARTIDIAQMSKIEKKKIRLQFSKFKK